MAWYEDLLKGLGGSLGGGLGQAAVGGFMDLLGLGGKETKQALPKGPAPKLEMDPIQAPAPPTVPFQPPSMAGGPAGAMGGGAMKAAFQKAMQRYLGGGGR